jgi:hypothetical protein
MRAVRIDRLRPRGNLAIGNHGGSPLNSLDSLKAFVENNPHNRTL